MTNPYENDDSITCDFGCNGPAYMVKVDGKTHPLCGPCASDKTDECHDCERTFWVGQMTRVFGTPHLYCPDCAMAYQVVVQGQVAELMADMRRHK